MEQKIEKNIELENLLSNTKEPILIKIAGHKTICDEEIIFNEWIEESNEYIDIPSKSTKKLSYRYKNVFQSLNESFLTYVRYFDVKEGDKQTFSKEIHVVNIRFFHSICFPYPSMMQPLY